MDILTFDDLISRIEIWVKAQQDIQAAIIIGSRARTNVPADDWSDLDLILLADKPDFYIHSENWLNQIHPYSITFLEKTAIGNGIERRVLFSPHYDVDFIILTPEHFSGMLQVKEVQQVFKKGCKILFDKIDVTNGLKVPDECTEEPVLPTKEQYDNLVQDFWYHIVWVSKKMLRGELWVAKECLDSNLKYLLRTMAEWHATAVLNHTPWHNGRFIEKWGDPRLVDFFPKIFATYNRSDMLKAMMETMEIFRLLATETGTALGYKYPDSADKAAVTFIHSYEDSIHTVK
jgi:aminoglycoside 6-adenylyltransferase